MKKIILFSICFLLFSVSMYSQISKDSLIKLMSNETCEEIGKKDFSNKNMDELQVELGMAMLPIIAKYENELKTVLDVSMDDQKGLENMGRLVGMQLAKDCPAFLKIFMNNPQAIKDVTGKNIETSSGSTSGILLKIVPGDFAYIQVKDGSGKTEKIWWMEYFDGSDKLVNSPQNYLNKAVKVNYVEKDMYNSTLKEYVKVKIITGIQ